jgi:hypothetical protein
MYPSHAVECGVGTGVTYETRTIRGILILLLLADTLNAAQLKDLGLGVETAGRPPVVTGLDSLGLGLGGIVNRLARFSDA